MRYGWLYLALTFSLAAVFLLSSAGAQQQASDGSALWTIEYSLVLETPEDVEAWNQTCAQDRNAFLQQFRNDMTASVARSAQVTGRAMEAHDFGLEFRLVSTPSSWLGTIEYTFTWGGFAVVSGGAIDVGDAFVDGFYLESGNAIYIAPPVNYGITQTSPTADAFTGNAAVWFGDVGTNPELGMRIFNIGFPQVHMEAGTTPTVPATSTTTTTSQSGFDGSTILILGGAGGIIVFLVIVGAIAARSRKRRIMELPGDRELLLTLLHQAGGQAYQSDLVTATGFSAAKISLIIKDLHREGVVEKVRRGNRNIIRLK